jgi:hypothetical protein
MVACSRAGRAFVTLWRPRPASTVRCLVPRVSGQLHACDVRTSGHGLFADRESGRYGDLRRLPGSGC